eukprot:TRINITY_DN618_c0_g1_i1.p1 TRINITY_DN618_c0_g1~~TRINITY_DN618_c0_g1_i1.p1  ORF type:complete len:363 (-),score=111.40 TRINITY_DN618_c0_g1_i1:166-1254(-)
MIFPRVLCLVLLVAVCSANQWSAHVRDATPWFEGWYIRITAPEGSYGLIFGSYPNQNLTNSPAYVATIVQHNGMPALQAFEANPTTTSVAHATGGPITSNPDDTSVPDFTWSALGLGQYIATGDIQTFDFRLPGGVVFKGTLSQPFPWGPNGEGPEGWVSKIPILGFDWFVYSLRTQAKFILQVPALGISLSTSGYAHMEKNWGKSFPPAWMWAEGIKMDTATSPTPTLFALAGGPTKVLGPIVITAYLVGYRSASLNWNFHPQDIGTLYFPTINSCQGYFNLLVRDPFRALNITVTAKPSTFSKVQCPTETGFRAYSAESFQSHVEIQAYSHSFSGDKLLETVSFDGAALEYGGQYMCSQE